MASKLYYLITYLPALPELGKPVKNIEAIQKIREEGEKELDIIADLLELESIFNKIAHTHYVNNESFIPVLPEWLPEEFRTLINSFTDLPEREWITSVYHNWFKLICEMASKTGSKLLKIWGYWEWSLKTKLMESRLITSGYSKNEAGNMSGKLFDHEEVVNLVEDFNHDELVKRWKEEPNPMEAEKTLDLARIDFLKDKSNRYSFEIDELVAYMIELRVHNRYAQLSLEKGQKILEEVTEL